MSFNGLTSHSGASTTPLYGPVRARRPLRVMIDAQLWGKFGVKTPEELLFGLLEHKSLQVFKYSDEERQPAGATSETRFSGVPGWAIVRRTKDYGIGSRALHYCDGETNSTVSLAEADVLRTAARHGSSPTYQGLSNEEAARRREEDALALCTAAALGADLFITHRDYALQMSGQLVPEVKVCAVSDAVPVVGLYLRTQGLFIAATDGRGTVEISSFWWTASLCVVPMAWDRLCEADALDRQNGTERLGNIAAAVPSRLLRVIEARDDLLRAVSGLQTTETMMGLIRAFESLCLYLMGAFDAAARFVHRAFEPKEAIAAKDGSWNAGWQRQGWWKKLTTRHPEFETLAPHDGNGYLLVQLVALLRNSIHGEALRPGSTAGPGAEHVLIALPKEDAERARHIIETLGGTEAWGLQPVDDARYWLHAHTLTERLVSDSFRLLDDILDAIPLAERMAQAWSTGSRPPAFTELPYMPDSIRWQLGIEPPRVRGS